MDIFIKYSQLTFLNELWKQLGQGTQFFYDKGTQTLIFRRSFSVFIIYKNQINKIIRITIPHDGIIHSMSAHKGLKYLVYQTTYNQLHIFSVRQNKQSIFKLPKPEKLQTILQFEWIYSIKGIVDFIIVETNGVHLFKIDDDKNVLKESKFIQTKISCCWFDPISEILVTTKYDQNGLMQTYFFKEKKKDYKYKGQDFQLEEFASTQQKQTLSSFFSAKSSSTIKDQSTIFVAPGDKKNKDLTLIENASDHPHRIYAITLYGKAFLMYSNSFTGKITFYLLTYEKIMKQNFQFQVLSDIMMNVSIVDNLIIFSATTEKISIVYDIKKQKQDAPLGPPQSIDQVEDLNTLNIKGESGQKQNLQEKDLGKNERPKSPEGEENQTYVLKDEEEKEDTQQVQQMQQEEEEKEKEKVVNIDDKKNQQFIQANEEQGGSMSILSQQQSPRNEQVQQQQAEENKTDKQVEFGYDFESFMIQLQEADKEQKLKEDFIVKMKWSVLPISEAKQADNQSKFNIYSKDIQYLEDDLMVDYQNQIFFQFQLNLTQLPRIIEDDLESFLILLRRSHCKMSVFEFLRDLVYKQKQIMIFSMIYKHCFEILVRALQERENTIEKQEDQLEKIKNGYTILYPSDMQLHFFQPLSDDFNRVARKYLIELLIEFIRQFMETLKDFRLVVPIGIQNLLIKLLIKDNRMNQIHFLLQYQILTDNIDFAKLLIGFSSKQLLEEKNLTQKYAVYEPAFQLGIDMLFRMNKYDEILDVFLKKGKFQEAVHIIRKYPIISKIKLQSISQGLQSADCEKSDIYKYFEDLGKKQKTDKLGFTLEELKQIIYV